MVHTTKKNTHDNFYSPSVGHHWRPSWPRLCTWRRHAFCFLGRKPGSHHWCFLFLSPIHSIFKNVTVIHTVCLNTIYSVTSALSIKGGIYFSSWIWAGLVDLWRNALLPTLIHRWCAISKPRHQAALQTSVALTYPACTSVLPSGEQTWASLLDDKSPCTINQWIPPDWGRRHVGESSQY